MAWHSTGIAPATLPPGTKREVTLEGATVLLVNLGPSIHAVDAICTHEAGLLADGTLEGNHVVCPVHGATFDVTNGAVIADPDGVRPPTGVASPLQSYPTKVEGGIVWVDVA